MSNWIPYKIPPTPVPEEGVKYALSFANNATPAKNPSQFLEWQEVSLPNGSSLGDILYWNPSSGQGGGGGWDILPPPSGGGLKVLTSSGGVPFWTNTVDCDD